MTMTGIERISGSLQELLTQRQIIARCELLLRTYEIVRAADLSSSEAEELRRLAGRHIAPGIFASMMSKEPVFFDLPKLDAYTQMDGRIFHFLHTRKYSEQDFDKAYRAFHKSLPELKEIMERSLTDLLTEFLGRAGYSRKAGSQELIFSAGEQSLQAFVFASVKSVDLEAARRKTEEGRDCVILVPSMESPEPFVQFYKEIGRTAEEAGAAVWVANMEQGSIDPFIGYTTDMDIYTQFKNPRLAEMVRANWSKGL